MRSSCFHAESVTMTGDFSTLLQAHNVQIFTLAAVSSSFFYLFHYCHRQKNNSLKREKGSSGSLPIDMNPELKISNYIFF